MEKHKHEKIGEIGYMYRGLLIAKRDPWESWTPKYTVEDVTENILFANHHDKAAFTSLPKIGINAFGNLKDAKTAIDKAIYSTGSEVLFIDKINLLKKAAIDISKNTNFETPLTQIINELAQHAINQHNNLKQVVLK